MRNSPVQIRVSTRHGQLSDESQAKVISKVQKLTRIFERITDIEVVVDLTDHNKPHIDIKVDAEHKHDFSAKADAPELLIAVEQAVHKMEQQLRKYKEKLYSRGRTPDRKEPPAPTPEVDNDD